MLLATIQQIEGAQGSLTRRLMILDTLVGAAVGALTAIATLSGIDAILSAGPPSALFGALLSSACRKRRKAAPKGGFRCFCDNFALVEDAANGHVRCTAANVGLGLGVEGATSSNHNRAGVWSGHRRRVRVNC